MCEVDQPEFQRGRRIESIAEKQQLGSAMLSHPPRQQQTEAASGTTPRFTNGSWKDGLFRCIDEITVQQQSDAYADRRAVDPGD